ncbi:MAG: sensor histidine kinase [Kiritimatiellales bacterium]|nr:sensor histidine kinase [Kiritimatiellales bacterium]
MREQIARRDAEALHATTLMEQLDDANPEGLEIRTDEQIGFDAAVRASRLKGVLGIRFYNPDGVFTDAFPATILPLPLGRRTLESVRALKPYSRFVPDTPLSAVFIYLPQFASGRIAHVPTLLVTVPLHRRNAETFAGAAQFIVEGASIADEYARLDRRLIQIAASTFAVAGILLVAMLWPAFRRLEKLNIDLARRGERLQRANEELALAARTSAVGAISAHLMHGLKNPLASLSQFISRGGQGHNESEEEDWQDALTASRRMQSLVEQTLEVLGDARGEPTYELTVKELDDDVQSRVAAAAARRKVTLVVEAEGRCTLSSRIANLASLVLVNLLENAIEATPSGGTVALSVAREGERLRFRVRDEGAGFPDELREHLFLPCKSTREGGSGIGLAISKLIADHLDARLELAESSAHGCMWLLDLPLSVCQES